MTKLIIFALVAITTQSYAFTFQCDRGVKLNLGANLAEVSFKNEDRISTGRITKSTRNEIIYRMDSWIDSSGHIYDYATMYVSMNLIKQNTGLVSVLAKYEGTTFPFKHQCKLKK